ncbi:DUF2993 domain-containing protein [Streptomyces sp. NPDC059861]|uniref:LmeA family phospholipid-binding protein n=1 Tax=Streptomyces sp. NPDC059861 TaxID=3346974 RepID=UPI00365FDAE6
MTLFRRGRTVHAGTSRRARLVALGVAAAVLAAAGVAEAVARDRAADRLADRMERRLHTTLDVDFGPTPVMVQLARGAFPRVEVSGEGATFRRFTGVDLHAELDDVVRTGGGLSVADSRVSAELTDAALADAVATMTGGALGTAAVTPDPGAGELVVHAGPAGRISVGFRPVLRERGIRIERTAVKVGDRTIPDALAAQFLGGAPRELDLSGLPLGLKPERLAVTSTGLRLELTGGSTTVKA